MFDLPKRGFEVTESPVLAGPCAACGKIGRGEFPVGVVAPVQVGPTVRAACENAGVRLAPTVAWIGQALQTAGVTHADETGRRVAGQRHGRHARATTMLTWVACHANRGKLAFDALGMLSGFFGTLIHDGGKPYRDLLCSARTGGHGNRLHIYHIAKLLAGIFRRPRSSAR